MRLRAACLFWAAVGVLPLNLFAEPVSFAVPIVLEGQGVQYIARLGDPIRMVMTHWGLPERKTAPRNLPGTSYEYPTRGVAIYADDDGRILSFTFYCQPADDALALADLRTLTPQNTGGYRPFAGRTARGFVFSADATVEDLYAVYGEPQRVVDGQRQRRAQVEGPWPYRLDFAQAGTVVVYPALGWSCATASGRVVSCTLTQAS